MAKRSAGRRGSDRHASVPPDVSPPTFNPPTQGAEESDRWLLSLGLPTIPRWHAEVTIAGGRDTMFDLNIYAEEWGFVFHCGDRTSWIRVTDIPFVHGRDDFQLLQRTPDLLAINLLAAELQAEHGLELDRTGATIRTNIPDATEVIREWLLQPLPYSTVKRTVELCGDVMHDGIRCSKILGHDGDHEYQGHDGRGQLRWK
jgi:hypothetical protein